MGSVATRENCLALFDVDGTLTPPRKAASEDMKRFLKSLREKVQVGVVGGSDLNKIQEQLGRNVIEEFDYVFAENGLKAFKRGEEIGVEVTRKPFYEGSDLIHKDFKTYMGEEKLKRLINFILKYISEVDIPIKRGTFVEFRAGMLNVSPIGRNCSQEERDQFEAYDKEHRVRDRFVEALSREFDNMGLNFSIGGQISIDIFPKGWDKTYCLRYVKDSFYLLHFFGDKTHEGGNDAEIFHSPLTVGHTVSDPDNTKEQCESLFMQDS